PLPPPPVPYTALFRSGEAPTAAAPAPTRDPASMAALHDAWVLDMIGRRYPRSTATACEFMATSSMPLTTPTTMNAPARDGRDRPDRKSTRLNSSHGSI